LRFAAARLLVLLSAVLVASFTAGALAEPPVYRTITRTFDTSSYYAKGLLKREILQDAQGRPFTETENTYTLRNVDTGTEPVDGTSTTATIFPMLTKTDHRFYEGQLSPGKTTFTTQTYDAFGNIATFTDVGEVGRRTT
jgi:hypothetical protein